MKQIPRQKNHWDSVRFAIEGIVHVLRTQRHMRLHFLIALLVLLLGAMTHLGSTDMILLILAMSLVLAFEMINTAVETVVDMITQTYSPLAKLAKDIAAGAVLVTAIGAALIGIIILIGSHEILPLHVAMNTHPLLVRAIIALFTLIVIVVLITKVLGGKGSILSGGIVSGHSAVAFLLAVTIIYRAGLDYLSAALALTLALLVAQSRVEGKIHTLQEVVIGGLLGICLTAGIYYFTIGAR